MLRGVLQGGTSRGLEAVDLLDLVLCCKFCQMWFGTAAGLPVLQDSTLLESQRGHRESKPLINVCMEHLIMRVREARPVSE